MIPKAGRPQAALGPRYPWGALELPQAVLIRVLVVRRHQNSAMVKLSNNVRQRMQTLPVSLALAALASVLSGCVSSLTPERTGEVDSPIKAFVQYGLDRRAEAYLVCVYQAERTGGAKNEVEIQATVVDRIKGTRQLGESLSFKRVSDSGAWDLPGMRGKLHYIFLDRDADGRTFVDSQDPQALYGYTDELQTIVAKYRSKG